MDKNETIKGNLMSWKQFTIRLIEALRWPAALVAIVWILREQLSALLHAISVAFTN